ncbi:MAG: LacI family DNA-binding transcriptional regulator [Paracoccaceae bacterium]
MSGPKAPTLEDVAQLAGVSTATISRVLNDPDKVIAKTREKVQGAIDTLGYTPNFGGRALASSKTTTVGAIIPTMANAMFSSGIQAFQEVLAEAGVTLLIASTGYDPARELQQIKSLLANGAGGLLLIGKERPEETQSFLKKRNVPYVISWCYANDPAQIFVGFDNFKAAYNATIKILGCGHRKIAMISGVTRGNDRAQDRQEGVRSAVGDFGDGARLISVVEEKYLLEHGRSAFAAIVSGKDPVSVIICGNDVLAAGAMMGARDRGIKIPEEISIVGFDDIGLASVLTPPLTTVRVPQIEMGRAAAKVLLARLSGQNEVNSLELTTDFIKRASLLDRVP